MNKFETLKCKGNAYNEYETYSPFKKNNKKGRTKNPTI